MTRIFNRHDELEKRRSLRHRAPETEPLVWEALRGRGLDGLKFRRQYSVGPYVLDLYCPALKLALELDGPSHESDDAQEYDVARQTYIEGLGIRFLRFTNTQVQNNRDGVLAPIAAEAQRLSSE
jgi:very-short-patch-repair endonuclease